MIFTERERRRAIQNVSKGSAETRDVDDSRLQVRLQWTGWDLAGMAAGFLLALLIPVALSRGRIFWEDEMLGWMLLRDPSWRHMLFAYNQGADGGGFSFYLLGHAWFAVFGQPALGWRLP